MTHIYIQRKLDGQSGLGGEGSSAGYHSVFFAMHGVQSSVMSAGLCYEESVADPLGV